MVSPSYGGRTEGRMVDGPTMAREDGLPKLVFWGLIIAVGLLVAIAGYSFFTTRQTAEDAESASGDAKSAAMSAESAAKEALKASRAANDALCTLRAEVIARIAIDSRKLERSQKFLADNPNGIPGIPAALLRDGIQDLEQAIARQERSAAAFAKADCR